MLRAENLTDDRIAYKVTEYGTIAHDKISGEVANVYVRHMAPLDMWKRNGGLRETEYQAGQRYGALWREVYQPRSPAHSDTTRIIVDGGSAIHSWEDIQGRRGEDVAGLADAQRAIGDEETSAALNRLCGQEDWPAGDKRRFKRLCRKGLERLAALWRRR